MVVINIVNYIDNWISAAQMLYAIRLTAQMLKLKQWTERRYRVPKEEENNNKQFFQLIFIIDTKKQKFLPTPGPIVHIKQIFLFWLKNSNYIYIHRYTTYKFTIECNSSHYELKN